MLESAIRYAKENNWFIFPCREKPGDAFINKRGKEEISPSKAPYVLGGFKESTTEIEVIERWWKRWPNAGIGIDCERSNLVCIDIDTKGKKTGLDNYAKLNISDKDALHSITPSGGMHIVFSGQTKSSASKLGLDIRSSGAYFLAPPSKILIDNMWQEYIALEDWFNKKPGKVPSFLIERLDVLKGKVKNKDKKEYKIRNPREEYAKIKKALEIIPKEVSDDYFSWISVGLAIKATLGDDGFELWDKWSQKSEKYDYDACEYRWEKFVPREITAGTIFYLAKKYGENNGTEKT